ncbi:hypothetical protein DFH09DRAFT_92986 [Mycena vulgaris]|nr:hypothetical protein DFH09DRAFT_92986 [Mycena vulgaris]
MGVADLRAQLAALDANIIQQRLLLKQLETDRRAIQKDLQSIAYPVLTLPPEITSEIFVHCLSDEPQPPHQMHAPILLRRVCKAWERIATSTPALWSTLYLDVGRLNAPNAETFQIIVKTWFDRAGSCPLTLLLRGQMGETFIENGPTSEIICFYASRLRNLDLYMEAEDFRALEDIGHFPLLQALTLGLPFNDETYPEKGTVLFGQGVFGDTPALRQLTLDNFVPSFATISWQHLTVFNGGMFTMQDSLKVLRLAPLLTDCTFCISYEERLLPVSDDGPLPHPCLRTFSLVENPDDGGPSTADILKHITLPSLHTLRIAAVIDLDDEGSFQSFMARSSSTLRAFSLRRYYGPESGFIKHMAKLTHLELEDVNDDFQYDFLRLLETTEFLPELQNIAFLDCTYPGPEYEAMVQSLCSRWKPNHEGITNLRSFKVVWPKNLQPYFDRETVAPLAELAAAGAAIHIGTSEHNYFIS